MRIEFEIDDHGVDHAQYFPGAGVSFTRFTDIATGAGDSARSAANDAAEQAYMSNIPNHDAACARSRPYHPDRDPCTCWRDAFDRELDAAIEALPDESDAHEDCDPESDEECELYHYVSIRWRTIEGA